MAMTTEKLLSAFAACEEILTHEGVTDPVRDGAAESLHDRLKHLLWLAVNGRDLVHEGRREKAMRWLGFLQGGLWALYLADVDDLKGMKRPDGSTHDKERV